MTLTASLDALFEPSPVDFSNSAPAGAAFLFLGLALGSWVLGEALMAPVLQPFMAWLWAGDVACFLIFTVWYFRVSRLFDSGWVSYQQALPPMIWALTPLHLVFPAALLALHAGWAGMLGYELLKAGVILAVLTRMTHVFQYLNHWPRWSALALTLSPLAVALAGIILLTAVGGVAVIALILSALHH